MIGIIGGMGPHAGIDFCSLIIKETSAVKDQDHLPLILSSQPSKIPDRSNYIFDQSMPNPGHAIIEQLESLEKMGATMVGIPCVTAHTPVIFSQVQSAAKEMGISLLSIIDETLEFVANEYPGLKKIGVISTDATYHSKLFESPIDQSSFNFVDLGREKNIEWVQNAISNESWGIKAQSLPVSELARASLLKSINYLKEKGADAVILGCTELPLAFPESEINGVVLVNPMRALARSLIRTHSPQKLRAI